jgi:hypothetical protein
MSEQPYFDQSGQPSDAPGRFVRVDDLDPLIVGRGLEFTVGDESKAMHAGDCVVIPPNVRHGAVAGPAGCTVLDVFTPPRAAIVSLMAGPG